MIKVGLLGCAHVHAAHYVEAMNGGGLGGEVTAVFDVDGDRAERFAAQYGLSSALSGERLCREVGAVIVESEHRRYPEMVHIAAAASRPVLCEKPFGATREDCQALLTSPAWLSVAFPVRYAAPVLRARELAQSGALGDLLAMSGTNRGPYPAGFFGQRAWSGGGALLDHVVHVADALRFMTGCHYESVYAEAGRFFDYEQSDTEDCGQVVATTSTGAWASIDSSWSRPRGMPGALDLQMKLWFTDGQLTVDAFAHRGVLVDQHGAVSYPAYGAGLNELMLADWLRAVVKDRQPPVPGLEGAEATAVALAAVESAGRGEAVSVR